MKLSSPDFITANTVEVSEWDHKGPTAEPRLKRLSFFADPSARRMADSLRGRIDIREGYEGLEIQTTSFVGRVDIGPIRIAITPKLPSMPLATLLRYAYGLRNLSTMEETKAPTVRHGLHDLLIAMLVSEVRELISRGLARKYIPVKEKLESPRGEILIEELSRSGGLTEARLPCQHFLRDVDWQLNRVLRAGLLLSASMTGDRDLRRSVYRLAQEDLADVGRLEKLTREEIQKAERGLTRLTAANAAALRIIQLLYDALGLGFEPASVESKVPGFLFDMNQFFQLLVFRFLRDNPVHGAVLGDFAIRNLFAFRPDANPRKRSAPILRPDYAVFGGDSPSRFLDAKYRDLWAQKGFPTGWLYQLSIYALASPMRTSVLLYATMSESARDEELEVRPPILSGEKSANVILRPVPLLRLAELVDPHGMAKPNDKWRFAADLLLPRARKTVPALHGPLAA